METNVTNVIVELFAQIIVEPIVRILREEKVLSNAGESEMGINNSQRLSIHLQSDEHGYYELNLKNYMERIKVFFVI